MMIVKRLTFMILCGLWLIGCQSQEETAELPTLVSTAVITSPAALNSDQTLPPTFTPLAPGNEAAEEISAATAVPTNIATATPFAAANAAPLNTPIPLDPAAWQLLLTAEENLRQLGSFRHDRTINIQSPLFNQVEALVCTMRPPNEIYCDVYRDTDSAGNEPRLEQFEFVQAGQQLWVRQEGETEWTEFPTDSANYLQVQLSQLQLSSFVNGAMIVGETLVEVVPVQVVLLELDPLTAVQTLYDTQTFNDFLTQTQEATATATLWIGIEDGQMYRLEVDISFLTIAGDVTIRGLGSLNDHNQPVEIVIPEN